MNPLNMSIQDKRQTIEYINSILSNEILPPEQEKRLIEQKEKCELEIKEALRLIQK